MKAVLSMGWQVMLFRARPDDIPYAPKLIWPLVFINVALSLMIQQVSDPGMDKPILQLALMSLAVEAVWVYFMLSRRQWQVRWVQTFTGLVIIDTVITLMASPLTFLLNANEALLPLVMLIQIVLAFWSLWARGYIYQHALEISRGRGLLFAFVPLMIVMILALQFFPEILPVAAEGS
ncbi:MAG: hypothetical protein U0998_12500 [Moraxellaceae bacterium]|nr:hypothetical protein [Moraxellaceae bacterium]MDP1776072.1 hypothetical protein [Moraxellaceae bacterium]MDZ4298394.1 hypothetical protein [Moraxellaceae bacterium]MDZ4387989.1 hypothetical protein [Moraxellaceae bacterium]